MRTHLSRRFLIRGLALLGFGISCLAAGCVGDPQKADTDFPVIDGARVLGDIQVPSRVTAAFTRYMVLFDPALSARELTRAEHVAVSRLGWSHEQPRGPHKSSSPNLWTAPNGDRVWFAQATGHVDHLLAPE